MDMVQQSQKFDRFSECQIIVSNNNAKLSFVEGA